MRSADELIKAAGDLALLHGELCEPVAKTKSLLALAYVADEEYDRAVYAAKEAWSMCEMLQIQNTEVGLDIYYRLGKVIESKAITPELQTEAKDIFEKVYVNRLQYELNHPPNDKNEHVAPAEEETDSTYIYYDECMKKRDEHDYGAAIILLDKCLMLRRKKFGSQSPALTSMLIEKADILKDQGKYDEAKALLNELLNAVAKTTLQGRLQLPIADILNALGTLHRILLQYSFAQESFEECLMIRQDLLPKEGHVMIGSTLNNIAELYREMELFSKSIEYHLKALNMFERIVGKDHPGYANALGNYGITLKAYSEYSQLHGKNSIDHALQYMNAQSLSKYHPWMVKFGNEKMFLQAQEYLKNHEYLYAIGMYNLLLQRKLAGKPTKDQLDAASSAKAPRASSPISRTSSTNIRQSISFDQSQSGESTSKTAKGSPKRSKQHSIEEIGQLLESQFSLIDQKYITLLILEKHEIMIKACEYYLQQHQFAQAVPLYQQCQYYCDHLNIAMNKPSLGMTTLPTTSPAIVGAGNTHQQPAPPNAANKASNTAAVAPPTPPPVATTPLAAYAPSGAGNPETRNLLLERQEKFCQAVQWMQLQLYYKQGHLMYVLELLQLIIPALEAKLKVAETDSYELTRYYLLALDILVDQGQSDQAQFYANKAAKELQQACDKDNLSFLTLSYQTTYDYLQYDIHMFQLQLQQGHYEKAIKTYGHIRMLFLIHPELRVTILYWKALYLLLELLDIYGNFESIQKVINYMEGLIQLESTNWYYTSSEGKQWYIMYLNKKLYYASILANHGQMKSLVADIQVLLQDYWMEIFTISLPTPVLPSSLNTPVEQQDTSKTVSLKALTQKDAASRSKNLAPNTYANYPLVMTTWMANLWYVYSIVSFETLNYTEGREAIEVVVYIYKAIGNNACHRNLIQAYLTYAYYLIYDAYDFGEGIKCIQYAKGMNDYFYPNQSKNPNYSNQHDFYAFQILFLQAFYDFYVGNHGTAFELFEKAQESLQEKVLSAAYWSEIPYVAFFFPLDTWGKSLGRIFHNSDMIRSTLWSGSSIPTTTIPGTTAPVGSSESSSRPNAKMTVDKPPTYLAELLLPIWKVGFSLDAVRPLEDVLLTKYLESSSPSSFHASGNANRLCRNRFDIEICYYMAQCKLKFHEYLDSRHLHGQSGIFAVQYYALENNVASAMQPVPGTMSSNSSAAGGSEDGSGTGSATTHGATTGIPGTTTPAVPLRHHITVYRALNGIGEVQSATGQYRDAKIVLSYCHHFLALSPIAISRPITSCTLRGLGNLVMGAPFQHHKVLYKVSLASITMMRTLGYYVDALNEYDRMCNIYWPTTSSAVNTRPSTGAPNTRPSAAVPASVAANYGGNKVIVNQSNFYLYSAYYTMQRDFIYAQIMVDRQKFVKAEDLLAALEKPIMTMFSMPVVTWSILEPMTIAGISVGESIAAPANPNVSNSNAYAPNPNDTFISYWHYQWKLLHGYCYLIQKKYVLCESVFKSVQTYLSEIYKKKAAKIPQGGNTSNKTPETPEHPDAALPKKHIFSPTFYYFDLYWVQNHLTFTLLYHSTKVNDQQLSVKALREDILPFFQKFYYFMTHTPPDNFDNLDEDGSVAEASIKLRTGPTGSVKATVGGPNINYGGMFPGRVNPPSSVLATVQHMSIYQVKGRIGLLMNSIKKDTGRKLLSEALKFFDDYQPFPLPYDHPCVMELGGYTKATSKDRLSKYLQEDAMYPWAFPIVNSEILTILPDSNTDTQSVTAATSSNQIPKSIFVDLPNNSMDLWGLVHYYGTEFFQPLRASNASSLRGTSKQGARSRSPSPNRSTVETPSVAYTNLPTVGSGGGVDSAEYKALQEKLEEEIFVRKQKEDEIDQLKHEKLDLIDTVEEMKLDKDQLQKELRESKQQAATLQQNLTNKQNEFNTLLAKFQEIENELNRRIQLEQDEKDRAAKEEELLRKEKEYQEALASGTLQATEAKKRSVRMYNREETLALERNQELFNYTQLVVQLGFYLTGVTLFKETEHLYRRVLQQDLSESFVALLIAQGKNFTLANQFTMANNLFNQVLPLVEEWQDLTAPPPAPALPGMPVQVVIPAKETPLYFSVEILQIENHYLSGQWHNLGLFERLEALVLFLTKHTESPESDEAATEEKAADDDTTVASGQTNSTTPKSKTDKKGKTKEKKEYVPPKKHRYHSEYEVLLGKALALLAVFQMYEGKYMDSKISIEKSQICLLKGSHNQMNTIDYVENNFIKGEIYLGLCKPKDTLIIIDQNFMILKVLLKQYKTQYEENPYAKKQSAMAEEFKANEDKKESGAKSSKPTADVIVAKKDSPFDIDHPYLAKCNLIAAKALIVQTQYLKAKQKLATAKKMLLSLNFPKNDLRLLEVEYYEGLIHFLVSNYYDAKLLFDSLLNTLLQTSLRVAFMTHDQLNSENKQPRVFLSINQEREDPDAPKTGATAAELESKALLLQLRKHPFVMKTYYALALVETKFGHFELAMQFISEDILSMHIISTPVPEKTEEEKQKEIQQAAKLKTNVAKPKRIITFFNNLLVIETKLLQIHISQCVGRYKQSMNLVEDLYYHCNKLFPTGDHHVIIMTQYYYAEYHYSNQAFDDAIQLYQDNINSLKSMYFNMDHGLSLENELALIRLYLHMHDHIEATNQLMSAKNAAINVYGGFLSHEVFLQIEAFESILLLHQLKDGDDEEDGDDEAKTGKDDEVNIGLGDDEEKDDEPRVEELDEIDDHISKSHNSKAHSSVHDETDDQTSVTSLPYFEHEKYLQVIEKFIETLEKYELLFKFPSGSLLSYPRPIPSSNQNEEKSSRFVDMSIISPFLQYFLGLYGEIQLMEFLAFQAYFKSLSTPQKEFYYALIQGGGNSAGMMLDMITTGNNMCSSKAGKFQGMSSYEQQEWSRKRKHNIEQVKLMLTQMLQPTVGTGGTPPTTGLASGNKNAIVSIKLDPPGKSSIELAIQRLKYFWQVDTSYYYLLELQDVLMNLSLQYDDIQIAQLHYFTAQKYQAIAQYRPAEISYQEALIVYNTALGLESCLQSSIIAELIYQLGMTMKAVSSQYECMKALFFLSMKIYKNYILQQQQALLNKQQDDDSSMDDDDESIGASIKSATSKPVPGPPTQQQFAENSISEAAPGAADAVNDPLQQGSIASSASVGGNNAATDNSKPTSGEIEVNDPFIWKNIYALTSVFVDQKLYHDAFAMHLQLQDLVIKAIGLPSPAPINEAVGPESATPGSARNQPTENLSAKIASVLTSNLTSSNASNNGLILSYLVKTKIAIANDLLNLCRYQESYNYNEEALELLKALSKIVNSGILSANDMSGTTNMNRSSRPMGASTMSSVTNASAVVINSDLSSDMLAQYLIEIYSNHIEIYDYLGQFQISDDFIQQIETIFTSWQKSIDQMYAAPTDPHGMPLPLSKTGASEVDPSTAVFASVSRPTTNHKPNKSHPRNGVKPVKDFSLVSTGPPGNATADQEEDQYDAAQLSKFVDLRTIQAQYYIVLSKHHMIVNKFNEAHHYLTEATSLRLLLFNPHAAPSPLTGTSTTGAKKATASTASLPGGANTTGVLGNISEYSNAKLAELRQQSFSIVKLLLVTDVATMQIKTSKPGEPISNNTKNTNTNTDASNPKKKAGKQGNNSYFQKKVDEEQPDELDSRMQTTNEDILQDFQSTASAKANNEPNTQEEGKDSENVPPASNGGSKKAAPAFSKNPYNDIKLLHMLFDTEHKVFFYQGRKIPSHPLLMEMFALFCQYNMLTNHLPQCTEYLNLLQDMLLALYEYGTFPTNSQGLAVTTTLTGYTLFIHRTTAKLKQSQNQLVECKALYLTYLEKQIQYNTGNVEYALGVADALALLGKFSLLMGHFDDSMQYLNDSLKIERVSYTKNVSIVLTTFANALAMSSANQNPSGNNSMVAAMLSILPKSMTNAKFDPDNPNRPKTVTFSDKSPQESNANDALHSLFANSTTFSTTNKDYHYRIQGLLVSCAEILYSKGFFQDSIDLLDSVLGILKNIYGHDLHGAIFKAIVLKGRNLMELSKYPESFALFQQCKSIGLIVYQDHHYQFGLLSYYFAVIYKFMGKVLEAKQSLESSMKCIRTSFGKYHFYTVQILLEMGINFMELGKYMTAEHVMNRAIHLLKKSFGKDHMLIAYGLNAMAELQIAQGFLDKVTPPLEEALFIARKNMQTDRYPLIPVIMGNKAVLKALRGVYDLAIQGYDDCIAMLKLIFHSPNHYFISKITLYLAYAVLAQGKLYEATIHFDKIYHMTKVLFNQDHVVLYEAQYGIAQCYFAMGKIDQAKALYERCLYSMKDWRGSNHPVIGSILNKLGDVYNLLCRVSMAESLLKESWIIRMKTLKPCNENHPDLAENMLSLAENLRLRGIYDEVSKPVKKKKPKSAEGKSGDEKKEGDAKAAKESEDIIEEELLDVPTQLPKKSAATVAAENDEDEKLLSAVRSNKPADDEISAPTVAISTIEMLDADGDLDNGEGLENILPAGGIFDPMNLFNDEKMYRAFPLVNKAIETISYYLDHDLNHPMILKGRFLLAEIMKNLGHYEKALDMHQILFQQRRKLLGEQHLETITSVVAMGEILRMMKRVFANTKGLSHTSAAVDGNYIGSGPKMSGNVSLLEHLVSVAKPTDRPKSAPSSIFNMDEELDEGSDEEDSVMDPKKKMQKLLMSVSHSDWKFLTRIDEDEETKRKKKKPLPIPRGYMGYAFPTVKKEAKALTADAVFGSSGDAGGGEGTADGAGNGNGGKKRVKSAGGNGSAGGGGGGALLDPKKLIELAMSMLKKIFSAEDNGISGYKKGELYDHPLMALCLYNRAEIMRLRGDGLQALKTFEQTLAMRRRLFRSHHPTIADCLYSMAELLRVDTRYPQALPIYDKALELRQEAFGEDHPSIAEIHNSLALIHIAQGQYSVAEEKIKLAMQICVAYLGPDHPASILLYTNQAGLYQSMGKMKEAILWCKKSLQYKQQFYGENHPETASTLNNLGLLYKTQNKYESSLQMFHKALEIQRSVLGNSHPEVATTYNNIGALLALQDGKKFEAKEYFKQSLAIRTMCYGEMHGLVASTMNNYACLLYSLNEVSAAKEMFEKALQTRRTILSEDHPSIGESYHNLGYWYTMQHCYLDAKYHYEEALRIRKKVYGEEHILVAASALHLSNACDMVQEIETALMFAKESMTVRSKLLGTVHPETIMAEKQVTYLEHRLLHHQQQFAKTKSSFGSTPGSSLSQNRPGTQGNAKRPASRVGPENLQFDLATGLGNDLTD